MHAHRTRQRHVLARRGYREAVAEASVRASSNRVDIDDDAYRDKLVSGASLAGDNGPLMTGQPAWMPPCE